MPLEIRELHIKVNVNQAKSEGGEGSSASPTIEDAGSKSDPEKMAQDIVEQVLKIVDDKNER
jgi:hypothetical protein